MQMCRQLAQHVPVVYVNSIGVRTPRLGEGAMFFRRVARKLNSWRRGTVHVEKQFWVLSPITIPGRAGRRIARRIVPMQIKRTARNAGIRRPLIWVECPAAAEIVTALKPAALVYQRTDRYEEFPNVARELIEQDDRHLKQQADLTLFCSSTLYDAERLQCRHAQLIDHGVDFDRFHAAGRGEIDEPHDMRHLPRPRVGFVGGVDAHTFDAALFNRVAAMLSDLTFVIVGGCSLPAGWCLHRHVHLLGQRPYESVPAYMAACDVLIMPWNRNRWIEACNPVKLKEYLAVGRPVVSTPFGELARYEGLVEVASDAETFSAAIRRCLVSAGNADRRIERVRHETWTAKAGAVLNELARLGIVPIGATSSL